MAASHWDREELGNEIMTSTSISEERFSVFTLAFMKSTGWYDVDYNKADTLYYGKELGCRFLEQTCKDTEFEYPDYCYPDDPDMKCNDYGDYGLRCMGDDYSGDCDYWNGLNYYVNEFRYKCFNEELKKPNNDGSGDGYNYVSYTVTEEVCCSRPENPGVDPYVLYINYRNKDNGRNLRTTIVCK